MSKLVWRVMCELCDWRMNRCQDREWAIAAGRRHIDRRHKNADRWSFRVQGIRVESAPGETHTYTIDGRTFEAHLWEPDPHSRQKALPCGKCGVYQYLHEQIYGYVEIASR